MCTHTTSSDAQIAVLPVTKELKLLATTCTATQVLSHALVNYGSKSSLSHSCRTAAAAHVTSSRTTAVLLKAQLCRKRCSSTARASAVCTSSRPAQCAVAAAVMECPVMTPRSSSLSVKPVAPFRSGGTAYAPLKNEDQIRCTDCACLTGADAAAVLFTAQCAQLCAAHRIPVVHVEFAELTYFLAELAAHRPDLLSQGCAEHEDLLAVRCCHEDLLHIAAHVCRAAHHSRGSVARVARQNV
eukprot:9199-Heterococcus_DN1.PRE.1